MKNLLLFDLFKIKKCSKFVLSMETKVFTHRVFLLADQNQLISLSTLSANSLSPLTIRNSRALK